MKKCKTCKNILYKPSTISIASFNKRNFCSKKCVAIYLSKPKITCICPICNKKFMANVWDVKHGRSIFCSNECKFKSYGIKKYHKYNYGPEHHNWKGNKASYDAFHHRVRFMKGEPKKCDVCGSTKKKNYQWANLSGKYHDIFDYKRMCVSCHIKYDFSRKKH